MTILLTVTYFTDHTHENNHSKLFKAPLKTKGRSLERYLKSPPNYVPLAKKNQVKTQQNITPINQNKKVKIKNAEQADQINRSGIFVRMVQIQCCQSQINLIQ